MDKALQWARAQLELRDSMRGAAGLEGSVRLERVQDAFAAAAIDQTTA